MVRDSRHAPSARQYREDLNPAGSGLSAIMNQFSKSPNDDGKNDKSRFKLKYMMQRLMRERQPYILVIIAAVLGVMMWLLVSWSSDTSLTYKYNHNSQGLASSSDHLRTRVGDSSLANDPRRDSSDPNYFQDFYVSSGIYYDDIDLTKGVDAAYLAKNASIALQGADSYSPDRMHGSYGLLEDGTESWVPKPLARIPQTKEDLEASWAGYAFNSILSDSMPLHRSLPDKRAYACKTMANWDTQLLPSASVGIVFHNENMSVLLRSVTSVLDRTPPHLLREIILLDDNSEVDTHPWLGEELDRVVNTFPKVRLRRMTERQGLMMARIRASDWMRGDVAIFLDSHIEATSEWIEPLLQTIVESPKTIVVPKIVGIDGKTLAFEGGGIGAITFSWSLGQVHLPDDSQSVNFPSPAMAGGLFAANKIFFLGDLGGYDSQMKLYGGEEFELGFKAWMCGGRIEVVPCSIVGHIFRKNTYWKGQVYKVPGEEIARNKRRVAHVWMDEFADVMPFPTLPSNRSITSLSPLFNS
eukprot:GHVH01004221.1.p1 GENE.GHVH01004221.1~~GHVH01004221.1.p1  ORF type:complete len:526 (-),score=66.54 GHVH01004221.1:25-1602(-)